MILQWRARILTVAMFLGLAISAIHPASAGRPVDPNTLTPPPPPGAKCSANGNQVICHSNLDFTFVNEPVFDISCGTIYETSTDNRVGIRWYNSDGKLVSRHVRQDDEGTWSLSPTGAGPLVNISVHANWSNQYPIPGDEASATQVNHGVGFTAQAPGFGVILHIAGLDEPDGTHHGILRFIDDPAAEAELCAALGA